MPDRAADEERLVHLLAGIDFGKRYYAYYEQTRNRPRGARLASEDVQAVMASLPLAFKYSKREDFFDHNEQHAGLEVGLNVAIVHAAVELIFKLKTSAGHIGGPFPLLARRVERLRDPDFSYTPGSPKPLVSDLDELRGAVTFGTALFEAARQAVLRADWDAWVAPGRGAYNLRCRQG